MKIVFLQDDFPPMSFGGAGISTYELALGMQKAGHEVFVITTCRKESDAGEEEYHGLKVIKIMSDYAPRWRAYVSLYNYPVVRQVENILKKIHPDIVHINNVHFYLSYHCLKIAKKYARGVVFTARDVMLFNYGKMATEQRLNNRTYQTNWYDHVVYAKKRYNPFRNVCIKKYLLCADRIFSVSEELQDALIQNDIKNVDVMHTGSDVTLWNITEIEKMDFKRRYNLENKKIILFGGRLSEAKGAKKMLQALSMITAEVPDVVLLVVGGIDAYAETMKAEASALGVADRLVFTGWLGRDEIKYATVSSDTVVVPSVIFDAFPRIVLEAMASKKPVVGTCFGGAPEIIQDGVTGYVVNPLHPEEIAEKTITLLKNPEKARQFGEAGYARIVKDFNLEDKVKEYIVVYESVIRSK